MVQTLIDLPLRQKRRLAISNNTAPYYFCVHSLCPQYLKMYQMDVYSATNWHITPGEIEYHSHEWNNKGGSSIFFECCKGREKSL